MSKITENGITDSAVTTAKIADDAVTNDKLSNVSTSTIKGRTSSGTGSVEDLTPAQVRAIIDSLTTAEITTLITNNSAMVSLGEVTVTGASTVTVGDGLDIDAVIDDTYTSYLVKIENVFGSVAAQSLHLRTSSNSGASFDDSGYSFVLHGRTTSNAVTNAQDAGIDYITLATTCGTSNIQRTSGEVKLFNPADTDGYTQVIYETYQKDSSNVGRHITGGGERRENNLVNALQFYHSSGTITGTFRLYGIR